MKKEDRKFEKLCSFYVSQWHLATMILPYISKKVKKGERILTILESDIEENIKTLIKKLNIENAEQILSINWNNTNSKKYSDISNILKQQIDYNNSNIILINGCKDYRILNTSGEREISEVFEGYEKVN